MRPDRPFAEVLRDARVSAGYARQTSLASAAKLDRGTINKLETGKKDPSTLQFETLIQLADALHLTGAALHEFFLAADEAWGPVLRRLRDATAIYEGGVQVSLEGSIEIESTLDAKAKGRLLELLPDLQAATRERRRTQAQKTEEAL